MYVQNFMPMQPVIVDIFQSGPRLGTEGQISTESHRQSPRFMTQMKHSCAGDGPIRALSPSRIIAVQATSLSGGNVGVPA